MIILAWALLILSVLIVIGLALADTKGDIKGPLILVLLMIATAVQSAGVIWHW